LDILAFVWVCECGEVGFLAWHLAKASLLDCPGVVQKGGMMHGSRDLFAVSQTARK
jgi:hypothetical protein